MIGTATVVDGVPLFFDAFNEKGLAAAALNFPDIAVYSNTRKNAHNVAAFELIPWVLGRCESVSCAVRLLKDTNVTSDSFSADMPTTPLHWLIADGHESITVEPGENGLEIHKNPFGVLTNAPEFRFHSMNVSNYMKVSPSEPENSLCPSVEMNTYSRGMGGIGLPGDMSSASRFVRAVFAKEHTVHTHSEIEAVSRMFHLFGTVAQPQGFARTAADPRSIPLAPAPRARPIIIPPMLTVGYVPSDLTDTIWDLQGLRSSRGGKKKIYFILIDRCVFSLLDVCHPTVSF